IYLINTASLITIIHDDHPGNRKVPFWHTFKINVSGFALKAATPLGFFGGDPYKIMELSPIVGVEKATSSVLLYTMTHITAQCIFWALSIVAAALFLPMPVQTSIILLVSFIIFVFLLYMLWRAYRRGLTVRFFRIMSRVPLLKRWVVPFCMKNNDTLLNIDHQISHLYNDRRRAFILTLSLELVARICNCIEVYVILKSVNVDVSLIQSIVIYSFMSLFTNIFFFSPMQIGTREGGFLLAFTALSLPGWLGVYVSLVTRVRELFWIGIGILLMKVKGKFSLPPVLDDIAEK
ncbi:MAG: lysylphosphatidylglycerol synthase transmembrane domain-containing protein, partial [Bacteroidales bacterium]|nr:lysylphosphatidylglycerol synthase transmembrane domain-containing protein [Bacteroidales bacterium]